MARKLSSTLISLTEWLIPGRWLKRYELFVYSANLNFMAVEFLVISLLIGVIFGAAVALFNILYGVVAFLVVFAGVAFVYPYWRVTKRVDEMERMLPDAFFYLASSLRAGISFSEALEELTTANFGALTDEFRRTVAEIKKGRPTVDALKAFALRNRRSSVIYRSLMIIIEALERGAPMGDVLVYVGNDVREVLRIKQERKASTGMQVMFFIIISGFIGPLILGVVTQVMGSMGTGIGTISIPVPMIKSVLLVFVVIQAIISGLGIGVIREGKYSSGFKYGLLMLVMGVIIFEGATSIKLSM
ncbi:type II secretion system F family protein [Thermococcus sp.]|uniref:type II secretion system F family protein n=1 Tax=Thermococcus sp. TaxID=35749 RepID=UPI0025D41B67|nr:type II secretion system F family protein [Thermococcus sp.]